MIRCIGARPIWTLEYRGDAPILLLDFRHWQPDPVAFVGNPRKSASPGLDGFAQIQDISMYTRPERWKPADIR